MLAIRIYVYILIFVSNFSFEIVSGHNPELISQTLKTPVPAHISKDMYHGLVVDYEGLADDGAIQVGTRQSVTLGSTKLSMVKMMVPDFPDSIAVTVAELDDSSRTDVFDDDQIVSGSMNRSVREEDGSGVLVVEGEFTIADNITNRWPNFLGNLGDTAVHYGIRIPNQVMMERIPEIIGG